MILMKLMGFLYIVVAFMLWLNIFYISPMIIQLSMFKLRVFDYGNFSIYLDFYSVMYLFVLFSIVGSIHFFIVYYMYQEENLMRFVLILNVFVLSMVILMLLPKLIFLMLGWDGLGFSSFLLVAWFSCYVSRFASLKTFLINRLGDGFFLISLVYFFFQGHFKFYVLDCCMLMVSLGLVIAFYTKSAHFPFSSWLPDAMAAPTPVSALVHSSTLVTAGLYMLFRFSYLWNYQVFEMIHKLGLWTLFLGSLGACLEQNSKKIVAYSTISQLGLLSFILSIGLFDLFFFYMMVHALFKALLFISVGSLMLLKIHNQDIRHLSNCWFQKPLISLNLFFSIFSLSGFPFLSGFYIKELVVKGENLFIKNLFSKLLFFSSIVLTVYYSFRLYNVTVSKFRYNYGVMIESVYVSWWMFIFLYMAVIQVGLVLYKKYFEWLNFGSSLLVIFMSVVGLLLGLFLSYSFSFFSVFYDFVFYIVYMFKLNMITLSLNKLLMSGSYYYEVMEKGFYLFSFMNKMNYLFVILLNQMFRNKFFLKWTFMLILTIGFVMMIVMF